MRVLLISFDATLLKEGGVTSARMLSYAEHVEHLWVLSAQGEEGKKSIKNVTLISHAGNRLSRLFKSIASLRHILKTEHLDLISVQEPFELALVTKILKRKNTKLMVQLHGDFYGNDVWRSQSWFNKLRWRIGKYMCKKADAIRVVSQRIKQSLMHVGIAEQKIKVIPIHTAPQHTEAEETIMNTQKPTLMTVARLTREKGVDVMARALPYVLGVYPDARWLIIGDGPLKDEIAAIGKTLGVGQHMEFVGQVNNPTQWYEKADVVIIPSHTEGWCRVALEAMQAKRAIVMTDVGCAGELLINNKNSRIVPINDPAELSRAIIETINDEEQTHKHIKQAYSDVVSFQSHHDTVKEITQLWHDVIETKTYV